MNIRTNNKARFVFGFRLDYKLSLFIFALFCIDRSAIEPIIIDFCDDDSDDNAG
jgi:hypothetical protein